MSIFERLRPSGKKAQPDPPTTPTVPGEQTGRPIGATTTPEERLRLLYQHFEPDYRLRSRILDIREMDIADPRVKRIHGRTARQASKGGLRLIADPDSKLIPYWKAFVQRLHLDQIGKLQSDISGLMKEGNIPMEWIPNADRTAIIACQRLPSETIKPLVGENGQFTDPSVAYEQWDWTGHKPIARFALWQLTIGRLQPDNYDNWGCLGRPYLDATRSVWRKLVMTETDLVVRRHHRAPQRLVHVLEGVDQKDVDAYKDQINAGQGDLTADIFTNKKTTVTPIAGDADLDQIKDVEYLLDTFFSGAPAPKGLFGYAGNLSRDILEDLKRDFFDELDALQDETASVYKMGFTIDLLLKGVNPLQEEWDVQFAERRTETRNQRADLGLKYLAAGSSQHTVFETMGLDPERERKRREVEAEAGNPYPGEPGDDDDDMPAKPRAAGNNVSITPGNARKGESATDVSIRS